MPSIPKKTIKRPWIPSKEAKRQTTKTKFYDTGRWRKTREAWFSFHPLCEVSEALGKTVAGDVVDHIIPIQQGGAQLDPRNFLTLCHKIHNMKSGIERHKPMIVEAKDTPHGKIPVNRLHAIKYLVNKIKKKNGNTL